MERLSVTLKGGKGYEAPWIVFKGTTVEEVHEELRKLQGNPDLLQATAIVAANFQGYVMSESGRQETTNPENINPTYTQQGTHAQTQPAAPESRFCGQCGTQMVYKEGNNAKGHWKGYFCPANSKHQVQWVK
jgi:hypothetical protein